jgi:hypothetical protein
MHFLFPDITCLVPNVFFALDLQYFQVSTDNFDFQVKTEPKTRKCNYNTVLSYCIALTRTRILLWRILLTIFCLLWFACETILAWVCYVHLYVVEGFRISLRKNPVLKRQLG